MLKETTDRLFGAWWGAFLGDAVAVPSHGYTSSKLLASDYGSISDLVAPKNIHPQSVLYSLPCPELPQEFDYIGDRRPRWRVHGTHPHYGFQAGENTLSLVLALHLAASMIEAGKFDVGIWMERYKAVMTTAGMHNDTFVPSVHRRYFENLASGKDPEKNGCPDAHMSDVAIFFPLMLMTLKNPDAAQMDIYRALRKFTVGETASASAIFLGELVSYVIRGSTIEDAIYKRMTTDRHVSLAFPYRRWIKNGEDSQAVASTGILAALEESVPLSIYLSLKYNSNLETALYANANLGGESTGRGAIIGMLVGAQNGFSSISKKLLERLKYEGEIQALGDYICKSVA